MPSVTLAAVHARSGRPTFMVKQAGDRHLQLEWGSMKVDLRLNFCVHALLEVCRSHPIQGVSELAPGFRTVLVTFDPDLNSRANVVAALVDREQNAPIMDALVLPSREVTLPIAFDDETTRAAVHRYRITTRADAPNVQGGDNIDYVARYNGFAGRDELCEQILATPWWMAFLGYFPGLPSLFPLDPLVQLSAPKYNPARMWTAEGAVGIGGPCVVIYPMETPGSYQLFGRTLPVWDRRMVAASDSALLRVGDRIRFTEVSEKQLLDARRDFYDGAYRFDVSDAEFIVAEYLAEVDRLAGDAAVVAATRAAAAAAVAVP